MDQRGRMGALNPLTLLYLGHCLSLSHLQTTASSGFAFNKSSCSFFHVLALSLTHNYYLLPFATKGFQRHRSPGLGLPGWQRHAEERTAGVQQGRLVEDPNGGLRSPKGRRPPTCSVQTSFQVWDIKRQVRLRDSQ